MRGGLGELASGKLSADCAGSLLPLQDYIAESDSLAVLHSQASKEGFKRQCTDGTATAAVPRLSADRYCAANAPSCVTINVDASVRPADLPQDGGVALLGSNVPRSLCAADQGVRWHPGSDGGHAGALPGGCRGTGRLHRLLLHRLLLLLPLTLLPLLLLLPLTLLPLLLLLLLTLLPLLLLLLLTLLPLLLLLLTLLPLLLLLLLTLLPLLLLLRRRRPAPPPLLSSAARGGPELRLPTCVLVPPNLCVQSDLGNISSEIRSLQEQSTSMSVRLKNRRTVQVGRAACCVQQFSS